MISRDIIFCGVDFLLSCPFDRPSRNGTVYRDTKTLWYPFVCLVPLKQVTAEILNGKLDFLCSESSVACISLLSVEFPHKVTTNIKLSFKHWLTKKVSLRWWKIFISIGFPKIIFLKVRIKQTTKGFT